MPSARTCLLFLVLHLLISGGGAAACRPRQDQQPHNTNQAENRNSAPAPTPTPAPRGPGAAGGELKVLSSGTYSQVEDAFVAVARDAETYAAMREMLAKELPELSADFFRHNAVIAAFLGQRPSGGYGVNITRDAAGVIHIEQQSPPKGSMTTQALTAPFKVVSVAIGDSSFNTEDALAVELGGAWQEASRSYRVTAGEFTMSGGFAGRAEKFSLAGDLRIMRHGGLATFIFNLKGNAEKRARVLKEVATGLVRKDNGLTVNYLDAGSLVDLPRGPLKANGRFTEGENSISLSFDSLPSNIADGYGGEGRLDASATAPPPQKKG